MSKTECIKEALKGLPKFSKEDLEQYINDVTGRAQLKDKNLGSDAIDQAMREVNDETNKSLFEETRTRARNVEKREANIERINSGKDDMRSFVARRGFNKEGNISSAQRAAEGRLSHYIFSDMEQSEVTYLEKGDHEMEVASAYDGIKIDSPIAKKWGQKFKDYFDYRSSESILSGARSSAEIREDRMFRQAHDQNKLINGNASLIDRAKNPAKKYDPNQMKRSWVDFIKQHLDLKKTFHYTKARDLKTGEIDMGVADDILSSIYDNITRGFDNIFTTSSVVNNAEALAKKSRMFFVYKDMRSFVKYNKEYGKGNLFSAMLSDVHASGKEIGTAEIFGSSSLSMYNDLRAAQQKVNPKGGYWWGNTDNYFKTTTGTGMSSRSPTVSNFVANTNMVTAMARLPLVTLQSIGDIGYVSSIAQRMGSSYFGAYLYHLRNAFDLVKSDERQYIAKQFKLMVDSHMGYMGRWAEASSGSEVLSKVSTAYFKGIGLNAFDRGNKIGAMHLMAKHLYENSKKSYGELQPQLQKWVSQFMGEKEWDLLRKKNNNKLFTTDNVTQLSNDELKQFHGEGEKKVPLSELRNDLHRKVYSMFQVASENAVLSPGEFERTWCYQGTAPGTLTGSIARVVSQFKMFTLSYIDRVLVQGFKANDTVQQKIQWAASMMVGTLPLSLLSMALTNILNNKSPFPDFSQMNTSQQAREALTLLAPGMALFAGILDPKNQGSDAVFSLLGSPSTRLIGNSVSSIVRLGLGDPEGAAKYAKASAGYIAPIRTTPIIAPLLRELFNEDAQLQPGQNKIFFQ